MNDVYSGDDEPTVYKKETQTDIKWDDITGDEKVQDKHFVQKEKHVEELREQLYIKMKFY